MAYNNLENYYRTNFMLMEEHKYSLTEIENLTPFERQIYVLLVNETWNKTVVKISLGWKLHIE